jgi:nicotinamide riboside transporter PnuC
MSPVVQEAIGASGFVTNVLGNILVGRKNEHGWWIRILSNALWLTYAWQAATVAVLANAIVFAGINVYYWRDWRRSNQRSETPTPKDGGR